MPVFFLCLLLFFLIFFFFTIFHPVHVPSVTQGRGSLTMVVDKESKHKSETSCLSKGPRYGDKLAHLGRLNDRLREKMRHPNVRKQFPVTHNHTARTTFATNSYQLESIYTNWPY